MKLSLKVSVLCLLLVFTSCKDEYPALNPAIEEPEDYTFLRNGASTVSFEGQSIRIAMATELVDGLKNFDLSQETLLAMYANEGPAGEEVHPFSAAVLNDSEKSIKSKVAASSEFFSANMMESFEIKEQIEDWIVGQVEEVYPYKEDMADVGVAGQLADGSSARYVSNQGIEYDQVVSKSLIGALMLDQICNHYLGESVLDAGTNRADNDTGILAEDENHTSMEHKWDEAYGYLFGLSADTSNPLLNLGEDGFLNKYLSSVNDDSDFEGIAQEIFNAFKKGRAAIVAHNYEVRTQQSEIIREKLGEIIAIRSVYYLQAGKRGIEAEDFGAAFHDLSEGLGFIYSLRFVRHKNSAVSVFDRTEVDGFVNTLLEGNGFWDLDASILGQLSNDIASKFNFTVDQAAN